MSRIIVVMILGIVGGCWRVTGHEGW
jgi:hypothetical protein